VIACYCRVSSARQRTDSQKPEIRRWLHGSGIDPCAVEWFEDKETSRATAPSINWPGTRRFTPRRSTAWKKQLLAGAEVAYARAWLRRRLNAQGRSAGN
jgi:hypothetical protein